jgi:hypothetical protein
MPRKGKPKAVSAGDTHLTPITAKERRKLGDFDFGWDERHAGDTWVLG